MATEVIQTTVQVGLVDTQMGAWEYVAGEDIDIFSFYRDTTQTFGTHEQDWWGYRGQAAACIRTTDGAIVRVRLGSPDDPTDRNIYRQIVTDPTVAAQWTSWSLLYSGTFYAVAIHPDASAAAGYRIWYSTSAYLYVDGVLVLKTGVLFIPNVVKINPTLGKPRDMWLAHNESTSPVDNKTVLAFEHCSDWNNSDVPMSDVPYNYAMIHGEILGVTNGSYYDRYVALPYGQNIRKPDKSEALTLDRGPLNLPQGTDTTRHALVGASERAGTTLFKDLYYTDQLESNYKYLFFTQQQVNSEFEPLHNLPSPLFFMKFIDAGEAATEPTPTGLSLWGFAGVVKFGDYIYAMGNGAVYRRLVAPVTTSLSNYLLTGSLTLNPDNQKSSGSLTFANPDNIVGALIGYNPTSNTDNVPCASIGAQVRVRLGQKKSGDAGYIFGEPGNWWISGVNRTFRDNKKQLIISLGDFWHRLENAYISNFYYPGKVDSQDWVIDGDNTTDNYFLPNSSKVIAVTTGPSEEFPIKMQLYKWQPVLDTRWRLSDGDVTIKVQKQGEHDVVLLFRYLNENNYHGIKFNSSGVASLQCRYKGRFSSLNFTHAALGNQTLFDLRIRFIGNFYEAWFDDTYLGSIDPIEWTQECYSNNAMSTPRPGYVGLKYGVDTVGTDYCYNWRISSFDEALSSASLLKKALGHAGFLRANIDEDLEDVEQIEILMGPQTDLPDPAKVLERLQENTAFQTIWLPDLGNRSIEE